MVKINLFDAGPGYRLYDALTGQSFAVKSYIQKTVKLEYVGGELNGQTEELESTRDFVLVNMNTGVNYYVDGVRLSDTHADAISPDLEDGNPQKRLVIRTTLEVV